MQPSRSSPPKPHPVAKFPWGLFGVLIVLILVSLLSGCISAKEKIVVKTTLVHTPIVCPDPIKPIKVNPKPLEPIAIQDKAGIWWVGFTPDHYGNISVNTEDSIRYIKDQSGVIRYYRSCITDFNSTVEKLNGKSDGETPTPTEGEVQTETSEEVSDDGD